MSSITDITTFEGGTEVEVSTEQIERETDILVPLAIEASKELKLDDGWNVKDRFQESMRFYIVRYTWWVILSGNWCNGVCWGAPRTGKTTALLRLAYHVYHNWDSVLKCVAFGFDSVIYKYRNGIPCRILEQAEKFYWRVPFILADDSGAICNKAITQADDSFDFVKGSIDMWGTKIGNLWHSMNQPSELTKQLSEKYTAELFVEKRGIAKLDVCRWGQSFYSWQPNQRKVWKQTFPYDRVPTDVYHEYAGMRSEMVDQLEQQYNDKRNDTFVSGLLKKSLPIDFETVQIIHNKGTLSKYDIDKLIEEKVLNKDSVDRCKNRGLLESTRNLTKHYTVDISNLGVEFLRQHELETEPENLKKRMEDNFD